MVVAEMLSEQIMQSKAIQRRIKGRASSASGSVHTSPRNVASQNCC